MVQQHLIASAIEASQMLGFAVLVMTTRALTVYLPSERTHVAEESILLARMCPSMNADYGTIRERFDWWAYTHCLPNELHYSRTSHNPHLNAYTTPRRPRKC